MKFTAQEEYGLRCILALARADLEARAARVEEGRGDAEPVPALTVAEIAQREGLTPQYAGKLIRVLGKAGLVESVRGRGGGYRLARPADEITVAETLAALGGQLYEPNLCQRYTGDRRFCVHTSDCSIRSLWAGLQLMIDRVLSTTTLKDLVATERTMAEWMHSHQDALEGLPFMVPLSAVGSAVQAGAGPAGAGVGGVKESAKISWEERQGTKDHE